MADDSHLEGNKAFVGLIMPRKGFSDECEKERWRWES